MAVLGLADLQAQLAEHPRGHRGVVGHDEDRVALLRAGAPRSARRSRPRRGTSRPASASRPASTTPHTSPLAPQRLRPLGELVEAPARELARRARSRAPRRRTPSAPAKTLNSERGEHLAQVGDLHRRCGGRGGRCRSAASPRRRRAARSASGTSMPASASTSRISGSTRGDHVLLLDERQLHVELGELGLAVGARGPRPGSSGRSGSSARSRRPSAAA